MLSCSPQHNLGFMYGNTFVLGVQTLMPCEHTALLSLARPVFAMKSYSLCNAKLLPVTMQHDLFCRPSRCFTTPSSTLWTWGEDWFDFHSYFSLMLPSWPTV